MAATKRKRKRKASAKSTGTGAGSTSTPKRKRRKAARKGAKRKSTKSTGYVTRAEYKRDLGGLRSRVGKVEKRVTAVENGLDTLRKRWT